MNWIEVINAPKVRVLQPPSDMEPMDRRPFYSLPKVDPAVKIGALRAELDALKAAPLPATFGELLQMNEELQRLTTEIEIARLGA